MAIFAGSSQVGRVFWGAAPVRETYEGSRKIMGFDGVTPHTSLFAHSGWTATNGTDNCRFSIPNMNNTTGSAASLYYCDDVTFNTFESGITLTDMTGGGATLNVRYVSESQILGADKIYIVVRLNNSEVAKVQGGGYVNTRIRAWYDLSTKTLKVQLDNTVIYTSSVLEWRLWRLSVSLGFYYYPPIVMPGNPPIMIDGVFMGGWVVFYQMNRAVGYPLA